MKKRSHKKANIKVANNFPSLVRSSAWLMTLLVFLFIGYIVYANYKSNTLIANQKKEAYQNLPTLATPQELPPTSRPVVVNNDPVVDCLSSAPNCDGESIRLKQSQCKNITCCQVGNSWSVYSSSEKCKQAQQATQPNQQAPQQIQITVPQPMTYPTLPPVNTACYTSAQGTYILCISSCKAEYNGDVGNCNNAYPYTNPDHWTCMETAATDNTTCNATCASNESDTIAKCN